jgi:hypothetical protein
MSDDTTPQGLTAPITVRLPHPLLASVEEIASELHMKRSEALVDAVYHWARLHQMGIDPRTLQVSRNQTMADEVLAAYRTHDEALNTINVARKQLAHIQASVKDPQTGAETAVLLLSVPSALEPIEVSTPVVAQTIWRTPAEDITD